MCSILNRPSSSIGVSSVKINELKMKQEDAGAYTRLNMLMFGKIFQAYSTNLYSISSFMISFKASQIHWIRASNRWYIMSSCTGNKLANAKPSSNWINQNTESRVHAFNVSQKYVHILQSFRFSGWPINGIFRSQISIIVSKGFGVFNSCITWMNTIWFRSKTRAKIDRYEDITICHSSSSVTFLSIIQVLRWINDGIFQWICCCYNSYSYTKSLMTYRKI